MPFKVTEIPTLNYYNKLLSSNNDIVFSGTLLLCILTNIETNK